MSSAAPKSVSQRTGSSASIVSPPSGGRTAKPWFWEVMSILPGLEVLDRVVGAAVAERQLERVEPDRAAEQLVAEADSDDAACLPTSLADGVDDVVEGGGVAGAVGEEDEVGLAGEHRLGAGRRTAGASSGSRARGTGG